MNVHKNAVLTPRGREILIARLKRGECPQDVATAMGVSVSTVYKWCRRFRAEGVAAVPRWHCSVGRIPHAAGEKWRDRQGRKIALAKGRKNLQFAVAGRSTPCDGADTRGESADPALTFPKGGVNEFISKVAQNVN